MKKLLFLYCLITFNAYCSDPQRSALDKALASECRVMALGIDEKFAQEHPDIIGQIINHIVKHDVLENIQKLVNTGATFEQIDFKTQRTFALQSPLFTQVKPSTKIMFLKQAFLNASLQAVNSNGVKAALQHGANPNGHHCFTDFKDAEPPLYHAIKNFVEIAKKPTNNDPQLNADQEQKATDAHNIICILLKRGAKANQDRYIEKICNCSYGASPIILDLYAKTVAALLKHGANPKAISDFNSKSPCFTQGKEKLEKELSTMHTKATYAHNELQLAISGDGPADIPVMILAMLRYKNKTH